MFMFDNLALYHHISVHVLHQGNREIVMCIANVVALPLGRMPHVPSLALHLPTFGVHSFFQVRIEALPDYVSHRNYAKCQSLYKLLSF